MITLLYVWPTEPPSATVIFLHTQVNAFLMKMVQMLGFLWNLQHEYKAEGSSCVNFPEFVTLVTEYFQKLHLNTELTCELIGTRCLCAMPCVM